MANSRSSPLSSPDEMVRLLTIRGANLASNANIREIVSSAIARGSRVIPPTRPERHELHAFTCWETRERA